MKSWIDAATKVLLLQAQSVAGRVESSGYSTFEIDSASVC